MGLQGNTKGDDYLKNRCVIVGGARINNYDFVKNHIKEDDFIIYCDGGLSHLEGLGGSVDLIIGDFDSHENPNMDKETIVLPTVKDDTDTVYAVKEAVKRGFRDFVMVGVIGGRFDHTLGNLSMLLYLDNLGAKGMLVDDYSEITLLSAKDGAPSECRVKDDCKYFSIICAEKKASGITIRNAKYEVEDFEMTNDTPIGVSNEVKKNKEAVIEIREGKIFVIKVVSE